MGISYGLLPLPANLDKVIEVILITQMLQLLIYNSLAELPHEFKSQIRAALQGAWPGPGVGDIEGSLIDPELHPTYFVLADGSQLRSYARTIWTYVTHQGQRLKLYGLGDVITLPEYRRRGDGGRIVQEATSHIQSDREADAALLRMETLGGEERGGKWVRRRRKGRRLTIAGSVAR